MIKFFYIILFPPSSNRSASKRISLEITLSEDPRGISKRTKAFFAELSAKRWFAEYEIEYDQTALLEYDLKNKDFKILKRKKSLYTYFLSEIKLCETKQSQKIFKNLIFCYYMSFLKLSKPDFPSSWATSGRELLIYQSNGVISSIANKVNNGEINHKISLEMLKQLVNNPEWSFDDLEKKVLNDLNFKLVDDEKVKLTIKKLLEAGNNFKISEINDLIRSCDEENYSYNRKNRNEFDHFCSQVIRELRGNVHSKTVYKLALLEMRII